MNHKLKAILYRLTPHVHTYGPWQLGSKGLAGIFNGELDTKSIQYRQCTDEDCQFKQAKMILSDVQVDVHVGDTTVGTLSTSPKRPTPSEPQTVAKGF